MIRPCIAAENIKCADDHTRGNGADCEASRGSSPDLSISKVQHREQRTYLCSQSFVKIRIALRAIKGLFEKSQQYRNNDGRLESLSKDDDKHGHREQFEHFWSLKQMRIGLLCYRKDRIR